MLPEEAASGRNDELAEYHSPTNPSNLENKIQHENTKYYFFSQL